ncbi:hypothetical protein [Nocardioides sp. YIM 152315]|uniref:hypothetical protein n=1 Tax=Nocardioides sp. YIM 152315 TaxID=3031760 RepID=UPI0023DC93C2|nr:hypothetical protein [Nocardioides sp. YIM 152315]MDF1606248.1 hypothetical protein [Nocardioides sp. YIM 152315]
MTPSQKARWIGIVTIGGILVVLAVFLAITWLRGDPTNNREENQPSPSSSSAALRPDQAR